MLSKAELAAAMALFDGSDGNVGAGGSGLGSLVQEGGDGLLELAELGFDHLGQFFLGLGRDFIHGTGVGTAFSTFGWARRPGWTGASWTSWHRRRALRDTPSSRMERAVFRLRAAIRSAEARGGFCGALLFESPAAIPEI